MNKPAELSSGSFAPSAITADRLSARQRWDHRYASMPPKVRSKPTPFVVSCLPKLPVQGRALDIAAGTGRHSIALAQLGLQVDAIDISEQGIRLAQARMLAVGLVPGKQIRFIIADIERTWLPQFEYNVILVSFFLHRPLFPLIKERLQPGGWLIYESFTVEQASMPTHRPQRREFLLEPDELKNAFSDLEILFYDEGDHNEKATAQLLAKKPVLAPKI